MLNDIKKGVKINTYHQWRSFFYLFLFPLFYYLKDDSKLISHRCNFKLFAVMSLHTVAILASISIWRKTISVFVLFMWELTIWDNWFMASMVFVNGGMVVMSWAFRGPRARTRPKARSGSVEGGQFYWFKTCGQRKLHWFLRLLSTFPGCKWRRRLFRIIEGGDEDSTLQGLAGSFIFSVPALKLFSRTGFGLFSVVGSVYLFTTGSSTSAVVFSGINSFDFSALASDSFRANSMCFSLLDLNSSLFFLLLAIAPPQFLHLLASLRCRLHQTLWVPLPLLMVQNWCAQEEGMESWWDRFLGGEKMRMMMRLAVV